ncbi:MAG: SLATT domain-containing protein [Methylotetracoccus sp.]|nr:SLATT domain-containing protein [Methylotetracoccus sp.]
MKIEQRNLLRSWRQELRIMMQTHDDLSTRIRRLNYILGIPMIVFALVVASYVFATIRHDSTFWLEMAIGLMAVVTAILGALQTFLKYSEQAEHHRNASARYQALFNAMDQSLAFPPQKEQDLSDWCDKLRDRWDELNLEAPSVPYNLPGQQVRHPNQAAAEPEPEPSATADDA